MRIPHSLPSRMATVGAALMALLAGLLMVAPQAVAATTVTGLFAENAVPPVAAANDTAAVELGMKFRSSVAGKVTGVQFYKGTNNTGTHTASLWSSTGNKLASATFTRETASGWQTVSFSQPVSIQANATYVVSYHAPRGRYAATTGGFAKVRTNGVLSAPAGSNGVYKYGASGFPTSSYKSTDYWVDVVFSYDNALPTTTPGPTATATPSPSATTPSTTPTVVPTATASPTSTASPQPTATPASCSTSAVWSNLEACGWAGAGNTGHPNGQTFKVVTGGLTVSAAGAVIDGYQVSGGITVTAPNVTIRNSLVRNSAGGANGSGVIKIRNGASATVENSVLDGLNATHACIWHEGASMTARGNECRGVNDGIFSWASQTGTDGTGDNFTIENNWLHSFTTNAGNGHVDGYQTEGAKNGVIRHNTIDVAQGQTSAIAIWNGRKSADNILVDNNLLQGGGFSVYAEDYSPSEASPAGGYTVTNVRFTNNRFSNSRYDCVGAYGVWFTRGAPSDGWRRSGNRLLETGQNLDNNNPIVNGWECR